MLLPRPSNRVAALAGPCAAAATSRAPPKLPPGSELCISVLLTGRAVLLWRGWKDPFLPLLAAPGLPALAAALRPAARPWAVPDRQPRPAVGSQHRLSTYPGIDALLPAECCRWQRLE